MKKTAIFLGILLATAGLLRAAEESGDSIRNWMRWRGPLHTGMAPHGDPPLEWSESRNIEWKIAIPGKGHATPIVWRDMIFIQTAVPLEEEPPSTKAAGQSGGRRGMPSRRTNARHRFVVMAVNRTDGAILWSTTVREEMPREATHDLGSWASGSPMTDGGHVYAYFGSRGLFCLDMKGVVKWERDFGQMDKRMEFGEGSSPALHGDRIFVTWDHEGDSFLYAVDKATGKDVWKTPRDERTSWSTPIVTEVDGGLQVIVSATGAVRGYAYDTGEEIWRCGGLTANVIPHPMVQDGLLYVMSGFRGSALMAIRLAGAKGDITGTGAVAWSYGRDTSYTPSGLLYDGRFYMLRSNNGILSCLDAKSGDVIYSRKRLAGIGNVYTSPVGAKGRIYILGQKGTMYVVRHGAEFEVLAKNKLDDSFHASPAVVGRQMFLRGFTHLYCIGDAPR